MLGVAISLFSVFIIPSEEQICWHWVSFIRRLKSKVWRWQLKLTSNSDFIKPQFLYLQSGVALSNYYPRISNGCKREKASQRTWKSKPLCVGVQTAVLHQPPTICCWLAAVEVNLVMDLWRLVSVSAHDLSELKGFALRFNSDTRWCTDIRAAVQGRGWNAEQLSVARLSRWRLQ